MSDKRLVFQLGTNNWQRDGEFAPGSGILHEAHHHALNSLAEVECYSVYPSKKQRLSEPTVRILELDHDIPICESISPVSSHRWHSMSDAEIKSYRTRLADLVLRWMEDIETQTNEHFRLAIAHHAFLNPLIMRDVIAARVAAGKPSMRLMCFVHGTALKMFLNERDGRNSNEYPYRFLPMMKKEKIFQPGSIGPNVDLFAAISTDQAKTLTDLFPEIDRERIVISPNGYNQNIFRTLGAPSQGRDLRTRVLNQYCADAPRRGDFPVDLDGSSVDAVVVFCGKFADWKRLDALLHAAAIYENNKRRVVTLVVGTGPSEKQNHLQKLAYDQLQLQHVYFVGPRNQTELCALFNVADVGCFPSYKEPFGLVFIECMACGTPVIGARSGGPLDFVTDNVGGLVGETNDRKALGHALANMIIKSIDEEWKVTKGPKAAALAASKFGVTNQVCRLLEHVDSIRD